MSTALRRIGYRIFGAGLAIAAIAACSDTESATDLHPEGPPMIEQLRIKEVFSIGQVTGLTRVVFGFGSYPGAAAEDEHPVTTAAAVGNKLRIIVDELLRGNHLEEIACRTVIDDDVFGRVPLGATPDDIARCAVARDVLPARCSGSNPLSVCICAKDGGCPSTDGMSVTPRGQSVGVLDIDQDGAADNTQFIQGAVGIRCGTIDVPIDLDLSYWTPSGNQQRPAQGGFDALGPAIVLVPDGPLPTSTDCGLVVSSEVVDKDGNRICAPPDGDIHASCTPGDTSAVRFTVEPMTFLMAAVVTPGTQQPHGAVVIQANVPLDPTTLGAVTVDQMGTSYTQFTVQPGAGVLANQFTIAWTADLTPNTRYTITIPTTVTDTYHQPAKQAFPFSFMTGT